MEFLEKVVQNERTGANITGIQVDTSIQHLLNKPFLRGFEELEKIAKEMDAIKIKNKRTEFELNLEQMDLDFAEKWNDPNIYKDKEKYEAMLEDRKALQSEKIKLLNSNIYYNRDEKLNLKKDLDNKNKGIILGYQKNRNIEYLKETINSTNANIDQIIAIGQKNISPTDYESISKYVKKISENLSYLQQPLGLTDKELENMIGTRSKTLINGIYQEHLNKIISDPNMSIDKQEIELKKLAYSMDNKEYKEKLASDLANEFAKEDVAQAKEYFLTSFDSETKTIINQYRTRFNEIKRARMRAAAAEERARKREEKERMQMLQANFNIAYNSGNYTTMENAITAKTSKGVRYDDRIAGEINALESGNINNSRIYHITGKSVKEINANNEYIKGYVPETVLDNMRVDVANSMRDGKSESQAIVEVAGEYSGDNPEMTQLVVNSLTQDGGYSKSIDVAIQANKGDIISKAKLGAIGSIEKTRNLTPQLDGYLIEEYTSSDEAKAMINKLVEKGADGYTAKKAVAEYNAGLRIQEYQTRTGNLADKDILYTGDMIWKDKNNANKKMKSMLNQDTAVEAFADSITPRPRMKSTGLKGDLKL